MSLIARFRRSTSGATAIEYGLILAIIAAFIIGSMVAFQTAMADTYSTIEDGVAQGTGG